MSVDEKDPNFIGGDTCVNDPLSAMYSGEKLDFSPYLTNLCATEGVPVGEVYAFMAASNVGKSMFRVPFGFEDVVMRKHIDLYADLAERTAEESYCERRQVGAVVITKNRGNFLGYNGMPSGFPNICELEDNTTDPRVIHAEANAFDKMSREGISAEGSVVFITDAPCIECAKRLYGAGVKAVIYLRPYRCLAGVDFLNEAGIPTYHLDRSPFQENIMWHNYDVSTGVYTKSTVL